MNGKPTIHFSPQSKVIYGVLHTTIDNYNNRRGGVLDYSPDYASHVNMNNWHDPVID